MPTTGEFLKRATRRAGRQAAAVKRGAARRAGMKRHTGHRFIEGFNNAYANAAAQMEATEALRANRVAALQTANPATPITIGGNTGTLTTQIKEGRYIRGFYATQADELNFICTRFSVNGFDVLDGNPINLSAFSSFLQPVDRFGPLTGRRWQSAINIEAVFQNIRGGPAIFHGININLIDNECHPASKKASAAPGFYSFRKVEARLRAMLKGRARKLHRA